MGAHVFSCFQLSQRSVGDLVKDRPDAPEIRSRGGHLVGVGAPVRVQGVLDRFVGLDLVGEDLDRDCWVDGEMARLRGGAIQDRLLSHRIINGGVGTPFCGGDGVGDLHPLGS